jgi:hypothetical protein
VGASMSQTWASTICYTGRFTFSFFKWRSKTIGKAFLLVSECAKTNDGDGKDNNNNKKKKKKKKKTKKMKIVLHNFNRILFRNGKSKI